MSVVDVQNDLLNGLNPSQSKSVQHPPSIPLQILAGPGSGKTKVLTSRIAYLILHHHIPAHAICAVTFTHKAALEMRSRLTRLIGQARVKQLKMGTFHALCALFLRRHGTLVGLDENFTICDADESAKVVAKLLKPYKDILQAQNIMLKPGTVCGLISRAKSKGVGHARYIAHVLKEKADKERAALEELARFGFPLATPQKPVVDTLTQVVSEIYKDYELELRKSNSLDFDDLLTFGVKLFRENKKVGKWCQHVLVDEFQDTNCMQYDLMKYIAEARKCVTIVGDPDQSIYGWRSADIENLTNMQRDFPPTVQIFLEQNYRSTGSILALSLAIISQDEQRIKKTLHTSHLPGPKPMLIEFPSEHSESLFIAAEIKRTIAATGGMLEWRDFAVLLRFNALSRGVEAALQTEGIPNRVLNGHKFFERAEIKDLLSYLQLIDNAQYAPAFRRVVNLPTRGIGDKSLAEISAAAERADKSPLDIVEGICDGTVPDIKPAIKRKLAGFVKIIRALRNLAAHGTQPADLLRRLIDLIAYEDYLKKTQQDWEGRWENVKELINFAKQTQGGELLEVNIGEVQGHPLEDHEKENLLVVDQEVKDEEGGVKKETPLRLFLQASMLSTDVESKVGEEDDNKVTISTCHAAKGLEWPVVMVPAVEDGVFPFHRAEDQAEERRLLYVACTRAQGLLYLTHATDRMVAGNPTNPDLSGYIISVTEKDQSIMSPKLPDLSVENRETIARVVGRPPPEQVEVTRLMGEFKKSGLAARLDDIVNLYNPQFHLEQQPPYVGRKLGGAPALPPGQLPPVTFTSAAGVLTAATAPRVNGQPKAGSSSSGARYPAQNAVASTSYSAYGSAKPKSAPAPARPPRSRATSSPWASAAKTGKLCAPNAIASTSYSAYASAKPTSAPTTKPASTSSAKAPGKPKPSNLSRSRAAPETNPALDDDESDGFELLPTPPPPLQPPPPPSEPDNYDEVVYDIPNPAAVLPPNPQPPRPGAPNIAGPSKVHARPPVRPLSPIRVRPPKRPLSPIRQNAVASSSKVQLPPDVSGHGPDGARIQTSSTTARSPAQVSAVFRLQPQSSSSTGPSVELPAQVHPPAQVRATPPAQVKRPAQVTPPARVDRPAPVAPPAPVDPPAQANPPARVKPASIFASTASASKLYASSPALPSKSYESSAVVHKTERAAQSQPVTTTTTRKTPAKTEHVPIVPMDIDAQETKPVIGVKRRLGMGRPTMGYSNKKFKTPGQ